MSNSLHAMFKGRLLIREDIHKNIQPEHRGITLEIKRPTGRGVAQPVLALDPPLAMVSPASGRVSKINRIKVFTATTKMRCGSFSLPAGPPSIGGTCPAAGTKPKGVDNAEWVCSGCYATAGLYQFASVQAIQALRREWVRRAVTNGTFVEQMYWALGQYFHAPRHVTIPLPGDRTARVELDHRYFRIHDSGDFSWLGTAYVEAWCELARRFPGVHFWAPTRDWIFPKMLPALRAAPKNLSIRPSALLVDEPAPVVDGLAAGTSVAFGSPTKRTWDCPAYAAEEHSCATGINPAGKVGCRVCWVHPNRPVNYNPHGAISEKQLVQLRVRKNPVDHPALAELYARFHAQTTRRRTPRTNPAPHAEARSAFAAWLAQQNVPPSSFGELEWLALLKDLGVADFDERVGYLEDIAEWG